MPSNPMYFRCSYADCEDETALKRRYLQLRVRRAGQAAKSLGDEERLRLLGTRRAELLELIASASKTIDELEARKEVRLKSATLASCLRDKVLAKLSTASANLKDTCDALSGADPLMLGPPTGHKRSTSLEALMREYMADPQEDRLCLFADRTTMDVIVEINYCLRDMRDALLQGPIASRPMAVPELRKLRSIQRVALDLARHILVVRAQPERIAELRELVERFKERPALGATPSPGPALDLAAYAQLRADGLGLARMAETVQQQLAALTDRLVATNSSFCEWVQRLQRLCRDLQPALHDHGPSRVVKLTMPNEWCSPGEHSNLLYIKIKHALAATTPSSAHHHAQELSGMDAQWVSQLKEALQQAGSSRDEATKHFATFQSECQALERLRGGELQALASFMVIKQ